AIDVPACARNIPFMADRELEEESSPVAWFRPRLAFEHFINRLDRARASDSAKCRVGLQVLQIYRPGRGPRGRIVAADPGFVERGPDDVAHCGGFAGREGCGNAEPAVCPKVLQRGWMRHLTTTRGGQNARRRQDACPTIIEPQCLRVCRGRRLS